MLLYLAILFCSAGSIGGVGAPTRKVNVALRYTTVEQFNLPSLAQHTFLAELSCSSAKSSFMSVCAELPNNWDWKSYKGYVYMNIFNTDVTTNLSTAVASTGLPKSGQEAVQCVNITSWPGGDMYIRVDANRFSYVVYTVSVKIMTPITISMPLQTHKPTRIMRLSKKPEADVVTTLKRVISVDEPIELEYNEGVLLEIDLCLPAQTSSNLHLLTTVLADTGVYTHFICKDANCSPDSLSVIGSQVAPLPVGYASAGINHLSKVYVSVYNLGGERDSSTNKVIGRFRFGGNLY